MSTVETVAFVTLCIARLLAATCGGRFLRWLAKPPCEDYAPERPTLPADFRPAKPLPRRDRRPAADRLTSQRRAHAREVAQADQGGPRG